MTDQFTPMQLLIVAEEERIYGAVEPSHHWHLPFTSEEEILAWMRTIPSKSGDDGMLTALRKYMVDNAESLGGMYARTGGVEGCALSRTVDGVAFFSEGEWAPDLTVIVRKPSTVPPPSRPSDGGSVGTSFGGPSDRREATINSGPFRFTCTYDASRKLLEMADQRVQLGNANLVLCEAVDWDGLEVRNLRAHTVNIPFTLARGYLHVALQGIPMVQEFTGGDPANPPFPPC